MYVILSFKVGKKYKSKNTKVVRTKSGRIMLYQNVQWAIVRMQNLLKSKKQVYHSVV